MGFDVKLAAIAASRMKMAAVEYILREIVAGEEA